MALHFAFEPNANADKDLPAATRAVPGEVDKLGLGLLANEVQALTESPFSIGHVALGCALGYLDYRFDAFGWRSLAPQLAEWEAELRRRPSFQQTAPIDG